MNLRISDGERTRYTEIYGKDPLASDGWLTRRMKHELMVLGCPITEGFDLLNVSDGQVIEATTSRPKAVVQIETKRDKDAVVFSVLVKW